MLISMSMDAGMIAKSWRDDDCGLVVQQEDWNPVMAGLQESAAEMAGQMIQRHAMPASMVEMDVDAFLIKMVAVPH